LRRDVGLGAFAGAERCSRTSCGFLTARCDWVRASEHAPGDPFRIFERRHGLAEIVERGVGVQVERHRVNSPRREREFMTLSEDTSRHGNLFKHQCLGFFEAM